MFFVSLLVNGILTGAVYALIALAFVVVYKSSRMVNFRGRRVGHVRLSASRHRIASSGAPT